MKLIQFVEEKKATFRTINKYPNKNILTNSLKCSIRCCCCSFSIAKCLTECKINKKTTSKEVYSYCEREREREKNTFSH